MQSKDDHDIEAAPYLDDESIVVVLELLWVLSVQHRLSSHLFSSVRISGALNSHLQTEMLGWYFLISQNIVTKTTTNDATELLRSTVSISIMRWMEIGPHNECSSGWVRGEERNQMNSSLALQIR